MSKPPNRMRGSGDPWKTAETAFKKATTMPAEPAPKKVALPGVRESVTIQIDRDVLDHFQEDGPGWQERINEALRKLPESSPEPTGPGYSRQGRRCVTGASVWAPVYRICKLQ